MTQYHSHTFSIVYYAHRSKNFI